MIWGCGIGVGVFGVLIIRKQRDWSLHDGAFGQAERNTFQERGKIWDERPHCYASLMANNFGGDE